MSMSSMKSLHHRLKAQLEAASAAGATSVPELLSLVNTSYVLYDRQIEALQDVRETTADQSFRRLLTEYERQNSRFREALDNMPVAVSLFDAQGSLIVCNQRFMHKYVIPAVDEIVGCDLATVLHASEAFQLGGDLDRRMLIEEHIALPRDRDCEVEQIWPDGRVIRISRHPVEGGGFLDMLSDITVNRRAMAQIAHMAHYDALTDLPNRTLFRKRLVEILEAPNDGGNTALAAVLCIDLDRFKEVNDTLGHPVGDELLIEVSKRLRKAIRPTDLVARFGGDEFAVVLGGLQAKNVARDLASRIIRRIAQPFTIKGHQIIIGASIGIEFIDADRLQADDVLRNADLALYQAKAAGRGAFEVYRPEFHDHLSHRRALELELREALKNENFELYYQPQFTVRENRVSGFEALVRWQSPTRGTVMPSEFIPLCEEIGLIDDLGAFVLKRACADFAAMPASLSVAVNLSPVQIKNGRIVGLVKAVLAETNFDATRLELEITETAMISDVHQALSVLNDLKALGVRVSLDDFGTGYSSLSYIRNFQFDKIKIDKTFIRDIDKAPDSGAIIRAVAGMCSSLGIESAAEGVETQAQLDFVTAEHCDSIQGFYFGVPVPFEDIRGKYSLKAA